MNLLLGNLGLLQKGLDVAWKRNEIIGNNIANADTPNFKASRLEFENILKAQLSGSDQAGMKATRAKHLGGTASAAEDIQSFVRTDDSSSMRLDGNNVDLENEMTELVKNTLLYQTLVQKASKEVAKIKYAISEGRR